MNISRQDIIKGLLFILIGLALGWVIFGGSSAENPIQIQEEHNHEQETTWTCSMHPQIKKNKAGACPICGMDLIPLAVDDELGDDGDYTVKLSASAMKIAEVQISPVMKSEAQKELFLSGKVLVDERNVHQLSAHYSGRIERLYVDYTGQKVRKGQLLASVYSEEIVIAQRELLEAVKFKTSNPKFYQAVRNKFKNWMISSKQIDAIEKSGKVKRDFNIYAYKSGIITKRYVEKGGHIMEGMQMFEITDLSKVWIVFDAYESDLPWIKLNDIITFNIPSLPNQSFEAKVSFIDPILDAKKRTISIRTEIMNKNNLLKPEMLVSGKLMSDMSQAKIGLMIPKTAVLWTGKTSIVYVKIGSDKNLFQYREIVIGEDAGDFYIVKKGLEQGEFVVTNGVFKIDAAAQLNGEQSMMNPKGTKDVIDNQESMNMEIIPMKGDINAAFQSQIKAVFQSYLILKDAMVDSDPIKVISVVGGLQNSLSEVDMKLVKGNAHLKWMKYLTAMNIEVKKINSSKDISIQRISLYPLSEALYSSIKYFKISELNAYYQYCPMANDNKGANWLSITKEIRNPYFGEMMMSCGETRGIIN